MITRCNAIISGRWICNPRWYRRQYIWWCIKTATTIWSWGWIVSCLQIIRWFTNIVQWKQRTSWYVWWSRLMIGRIYQRSTTTRTPVLRTIYWLQLFDVLFVCFFRVETWIGANTMKQWNYYLLSRCKVPCLSEISIFNMQIFMLCQIIKLIKMKMTREIQFTFWRPKTNLPLINIFLKSWCTCRLYSKSKKNLRKNEWN